MAANKPTRRRRPAGHRKWAAGNAPVPGTHRGDFLSQETRSAVMSRIRGKDTSPERILGAILAKSRLRIERHVTDLPGRPDFVFRRARVAVFVDGDFWHGWRFPLWKHKLSSSWREKIAKNRERDARNFRKLRRQGWRALRVWEHQVECDAGRCAARVLEIVRSSFAIRSEDSMRNIRQINNSASAKKFVVWCIKQLGIGFHPDTSFHDYVGARSERVFQPRQARELNEAMEEAAKHCDVYEVGLREIRRVAGFGNDESL